jgi:hypothetical protein
VEKTSLPGLPLFLFKVPFDIEPVYSLGKRDTVYERSRTRVMRKDFFGATADCFDDTEGTTTMEIASNDAGDGTHFGNEHFSFDGESGKIRYVDPF